MCTMLQLPEFSDSLINYTPKALEMMAADPDDLKISVEEVLSGTQARKSGKLILHLILSLVSTDCSTAANVP